MNIPFTKPYFPESSRSKILSGIDNILSSGRLMLGDYTTRFEQEFKSYVGTEFAISTNSCTTSLQIALIHLDVKGYEVLVPAGSFLTDISAVRWAGGIPVLVDIDPETLSFDLNDLQRKLTHRTKAIVWVHLTGIIASNWKDIVDFSRNNSLCLIEDCAHAHGASIDGIKAGSIGDVGCFSFYPTKVMTTGSGGMLTTNDPDLANSALELRLYGRKNGTGPVIREGNDWFMDEIRACIGYYQLLDLENFLKSRRSIANHYSSHLSGQAYIKLLTVPLGSYPSWYHYSVFISTDIDYNELSSNLLSNCGIPTKPIYIPLNQELIFRDLDDGSFHQTEITLNRSLCLPLFAQMTTSEADIVINHLKSEIDKLT